MKSTKPPVLANMDALLKEYRLFPQGSTVLCALSGGADSVCLFHALAALSKSMGFHLAAAHYNHSLRGAESERDQAFVEDFVKKCAPEGEIPLVLGRGDVAARAKEIGRGLEETAREMRYDFLRRTAKKLGADYIAVAHNRNDQTETILMHLLRGSGLRGLGGMEVVREDLVRPLLTTSREEIEAYLLENHLSWVEDSTNQEDAYTRNRIRHQLLPLMEALSPGAGARIARCAGTLRQDEEYLAGQGEQLAAQARRRGEELVIPAEVLEKAHPSVALRALRILLGRQNGGDDNCAASHLTGLLRLCRSTDPSAEIGLPNGLKGRREYDMLVLSRGKRQSFAQLLWTLPGTVRAGVYHLEGSEVIYRGEPQGRDTFYLAWAEDPICLRPRRTGDRLKRPGRPEKTIKKLLIEEKIPQSCRDALPVLEVSGQVAAVAALGPDSAFFPKVGERAWKIQITPADSLEV